METALEWHPTWSSVGVATNQIERKETSLYKYLYKERDISCNNEQWFSKIEIASVASDHYQEDKKWKVTKHMSLLACLLQHRSKVNF